MVWRGPRRVDEPVHQIGPMRASFPGFTYRHLRSDGLVWRGSLQPTQYSPKYNIRIVHKRSRSPRVYVEGHKLDRASKHLYEDGALCLYWPKEWRWSSSARLAETIVPWASLWLYFYEIWEACGEWLGPSSPHGLRKGENNDE